MAKTPTADEVIKLQAMKIAKKILLDEHREFAWQYEKGNNSVSVITVPAAIGDCLVQDLDHHNNMIPLDDSSWLPHNAKIEKSEPDASGNVTIKADSSLVFLLQTATKEGALGQRGHL